MTVPASLLDSPSPLRRLRLGEAPYEGDLHAGDVPTLWVDVADVPDAVWRVAPDSHVLAPRDIARTPTGHAALFSHCPHRLMHHLTGATLTPGIIITIAVSMLRAAAEADRCDIAHGSWWVAVGGRPVLVATGEAGWAEEAADILNLLEAQSRGALTAALRHTSGVLAASTRPIRALDEAEDHLFTIGAPEPLGDLRAATLSPRRVETLRRSSNEHAIEGAERWFARFIDRDIVARVAQSARTVLAAPRGWRRRRLAASPTTDSAPTHRSNRRAPWIVAAGVAAVVVAIGLAWPDDNAPAEAAPRPSASLPATAPPAAAEPAPVEPAASEPAASEPAASQPAPSQLSASDSAAEVLDALTDCAATSNETCTSLMENAAAPLPTGAVSAKKSERHLSLLDEYGGVSVFRVDAVGHPSQALVLVTVDGQWLVRDVYDLADQP